jgi:hypothetical protein
MEAKVVRAMVVVRLYKAAVEVWIHLTDTVPACSLIQQAST